MKAGLVSSLLILCISMPLSDAYAASKKKVTVATLAGTYSCSQFFFSDANQTVVKALTFVVAKSGKISGSGVIESTVSNCDIIENETCTPSRQFTFTISKLGAPKKKTIYDQSTLKKTTIDPTSGLTVRGSVRTLFGATRSRDISGVASLGAGGSSLATSFSCYGPETVK